MAADGVDGTYSFAFILIAFQTFLIIMFGIFVEYDGTVDAVVSDTKQPMQEIYPLYQDVHVMIFVGFGFLMTFLRKYSYSAVGLTFLIAAMCLQFGILTVNFWQRVVSNPPHWTKIGITVVDLVNGDFAAGAVLISFGAVIGRITPTQVMVMAFFEIIMYGLNNAIVLWLGLADIGGTYVIHMFGAYFGLAVSRVLSLKKKDQTGWEDNAPSYNSDVFSMIGTLFLWLYWPSFNGALATDDGNARHRSIVNTLLSISSSAFSSFIVSRLMRRGKFNMVDVQNATLAGGVAMGCCANMLPRPWGAMFIGAWAGVLSTFGFNKIQPFLDRVFGLKDTCGVNNLHGMPSIFGALCSVVLAAISNHDQYGGDVQYQVVFIKGGDKSASQQAGVQLYCIAITLGIAVASGLVVGTIIRSPLFTDHKQLYDDGEIWDVPEVFESGSAHTIERPVSERVTVKQSVIM